MVQPDSRVPAVLALIGCVLGLIFASNSSLDYAEHLDRRLHDIHCSYVPGASTTTEAESCRAAMYSSYGAVMRESLWGGLPVSLFALGAYSFFAAFAAYLLVAAARAPARAVVFFAVVSLTPLLVSILMFAVSLLELGELCETCVGLYIASGFLAVGGLLGLGTLKRPSFGDTAPRPVASVAFVPIWLAALGVITIIPAAVYAAAAPDQRPYLSKCGQIKSLEDKAGSLLSFKTAFSVQPALIVEDPLCVTCKAFHNRLVDEGIMRRLDVKVVLFPLDSACNWMLEEPLHPGACILSKAVLCGGPQARQVLEWAYEEQTYLFRAGKQGEGTLRAVINNRWGASMLACVDSREIDMRLNRMLHFAAQNGIPVSTPQFYLGKQRVCDEDTDIGLRFTLDQLAPEVLR
ncbi:MAG: hypothetical protein JW940_36650 [Polyangiaceae bacterium]|nr:hypothetical protein [Polyangiaceae bacterium]